MTEALRERLIAVIRNDGPLMEALAYAERLDLPDWLIVSGAVYQSVWNAQTGRAPGFGLKDVDLAYFDPDVTYEAEDRVIRRVAAEAPSPLNRVMEVRNQARVHLWFETRFGEPYDALASTRDGLERYVCPAFAVGVRLGHRGALRVEAPFGLEDVFAMTLRRNPRRRIGDEAFARAARSCLVRWPEVRVTDEGGQSPWTRIAPSPPT